MYSQLGKSKSRLYQNQGSLAKLVSYNLKTVINFTRNTGVFILMRLISDAWPVGKQLLKLIWQDLSTIGACKWGY